MEENKEETKIEIKDPGKNQDIDSSIEENKEKFEMNIPFPLLNRAKFKERILKRQEKIKENLEISNYGLSAWTKTPDGKSISKGCQSCKAGTWLCFYVGKVCNLECFYCTQGSREDKIREPERPGLINNKHSIDVYKDILNDPGETWCGLYAEGISYSGGEPFLYIDNVLKLSEFITKYHSHIYQWIYTNGTLVTEEKLKALHDHGVKEIRFHLGATNFSKNILKKLNMAKKVMDFVNVETPSTPELKEFLINQKGMHLLEDIGIYQINLRELTTASIDEMSIPWWYKNGQGYKRLLEFLQKYELYFYDSLIGKSISGEDLTQIFISPAISRETTYDLMEYAIENKIGILINDCSHDSLHHQRLQRNFCEYNIDAVISNWSYGKEYIQILQRDIGRQKMHTVMTHNKPQGKEYYLSLIKHLSCEDERGQHLRFGPFTLNFPLTHS